MTLPVASRPATQTPAALLVQRQPELVDGDAAAQPTMRLFPPVVEQAVSPAERRVLVDADDVAAATNRGPALHAPEEGTPALRPLETAQRRRGEGAERAAALAAAESLTSGEAAPFLDARARAVSALRTVAQSAAMLGAERKSEIGEGRRERRVAGHGRQDAPAAGAEE